MYRLTFNMAKTLHIHLYSIAPGAQGAGERGITTLNTNQIA